MAQLVIKDIEDELMRALEQRAARHGRTTEAEHRAILREVLTARDEPASFKNLLAAMPDVGEDADFVVERDYPREEP